MDKEITTKSNGLFEALKLKATGERLSGAREAGAAAGEPLALDDTERIKVLSPGRLVTKRFFRNKLALVGLAVLIIMFSFSFIGAVIYPYSQTQIFYKFDYLNINYASAVERTENISYAIQGGPSIRVTVVNRFNSYIIELEAAGVDSMTVTGTDGAEYVVTKLGDRVYTLSTAEMISVGMYSPSARVAVYDRFLGSFDWEGEPLSADFEEAALQAISESAGDFEYNGVTYGMTLGRNRYTITRMEPEFSGSAPDDGFLAALESNLTEDSFEYNGITYSVSKSGDSFAVYAVGNTSAALIASTFVFNAYDVTTTFSDEFRINALFAIYGGGAFTADGASYTVRSAGDDLYITDASGNEVADLSIYSIRRYSGQDTLSIDFKETVQGVIEEMRDNNTYTATFTYGIHKIDESGEFVYDENGDPIYADADITIDRKHTGEFVLSCEQITYLIDIFAPPTSEHILGTDGDGMDILARMMYGGRVSLMVGFVVVFIELILGVIMGGISGFFSGWVDTLIMRIVDVFYCIPGYPILIIMGALFDRMRMDPYRRLIWMMATLGLLGWAEVARLVRGQILSLREQEFMIAQEATGMRTRNRIFRHLVPNVMPQLIVMATMGVGEVIIYESTLSFLGLGVKHPLATWGTMINAVTSSAESMIRYTYIWVPVGLLICLTVIAFNFVGDGLRDAFDPKMRR